MQSAKLEVLPEQPEVEVQFAIHREGLLASYAQLTNEELIRIACDADTRHAQVFGNLITLQLVEI